MQPHIDRIRFGSITIEGETFKQDVVIRLAGRVEKREKELSKAMYGTSHTISLDEARQVYEAGAEELLVGAGLFGRVKLSDEAAAYFQRQGCRVTLYPTSQVVRAWNQAQGAVIGLFHITC